MVGVRLEVTDMILKLIHQPWSPHLDSPENEGFDLSKMESLLKRLERLGVAWEAIDSAAIPADQLSDLYLESTVPTAHRKYHVRQVFGSKRHSGFLFGKQVPALLVYEPGGRYPSDVYPHRAGDRIVTIKTFLEGLLKKLEGIAMKGERPKPNKLLVAQMDRLREKIGPIGLPVAKLIREGRRR